MAKVRVVMAEMDGSDATVLDAIRSFIGGPVVADLADPNIREAPLAPLEAPLQIESEAPSGEAPKRRVGKRGKDCVKSAAKLQEMESGCRGEVLALLKAGPKTSGDLVKSLEKKYVSASIYLALRELRGGKLVETREDPRDAQQKNFFVG